MQKLTKLQQNTILFLKYSVFFIIAAVPFYAFITTWIGSNIGGLLLLRAWKELLLVLLGLGVIYLLTADKRLRQRFFKDAFLWVVLAYIAWALITGVFLIEDLDSAALGATIQFRSFAIFLIAAVVVFYHKVTEDTLYKLVTIPAIGVVAFGLLQLFVLPHDFLKHFGYQKDVTIPPYFTIDEQLNRIRIASTLRGPNPLGAYLIAPIMLVVGRWKLDVGKSRRVETEDRGSEIGEKNPNIEHRTSNIGHILFALIYLLLSASVLYASHSRSAWLGLLAALGTYLWLIVSKKLKLAFVIAGALMIALGGVLIYQYRSTNFVQDVVLHDNPEEGGEVSSNQGRINAFEETKEDMLASPVWGCGVGCAGPASVHNKNGAKISENFYLQTVQELGVVGLVLLIAAQAIIVIRLLKKKTNFAYAWLAVFVGVSVVSMLSHAWADDTIAYIWWGVAGLLLGLTDREWGLATRK